MAVIVHRLFACSCSRCLAWDFNCSSVSLGSRTWRIWSYPHFRRYNRGRTEVLSTSVFLEISIGNLEGAVAVSMIMVAIAIPVLFVRLVDGRKESV